LGSRAVPDTNPFVDIERFPVGRGGAMNVGFIRTELTDLDDKVPRNESRFDLFAGVFLQDMSISLIARTLLAPELLPFLSPSNGMIKLDLRRLLSFRMGPMLDLRRELLLDVPDTLGVVGPRREGLL
jgi:hypothetical protein